MLRVCRQIDEDLLSLLAHTVPLDIRFGMTRYTYRQPDVVFMKRVIQQYIPPWYASNLHRVICWSDSDTAQVGLDLFPNLQAVVLRSRGCEPLRPILRNSEWAIADFAASEVTDAVRAKSLRLLEAATTMYEIKYPSRSFAIVRELRFGSFQVNVMKTSSSRQGYTFVMQGYTLVRPSHHIA